MIVKTSKKSGWNILDSNLSIISFNENKEELIIEFLVEKIIGNIKEDNFFLENINEDKIYKFTLVHKQELDPQIKNVIKYFPEKGKILSHILIKLSDIGSNILNYNLIDEESDYEDFKKEIKKYEIIQHNPNIVIIVRNFNDLLVLKLKYPTYFNEYLIIDEEIRKLLETKVLSEILNGN